MFIVYLMYCARHCQRLVNIRSKFSEHQLLWLIQLAATYQLSTGSALTMGFRYAQSHSSCQQYTLESTETMPIAACGAKPVRRKKSTREKAMQYVTKQQSNWFTARRSNQIGRNWVSAALTHFL